MRSRSRRQPRHRRGLCGQRPGVAAVAQARSLRPHRDRSAVGRPAGARLGAWRRRRIAARIAAARARSQPFDADALLQRRAGAAGAAARRHRLRCPYRPARDAGGHACRSSRTCTEQPDQRSADDRERSERAPIGWRWAPAWVLAFVALWPAPGYAEGVHGAGCAGRDRQACCWRASAAARAAERTGVGADQRAVLRVLVARSRSPRSMRSIARMPSRVRWSTCATCRSCGWSRPRSPTTRGRRVTFSGLAIIVGVWTLDALAAGADRHQPAVLGIDSIKQAISGHGCAAPRKWRMVDRLSGVLGPCNLKLGLVLASLSPFALHAAGRRFGASAGAWSPQRSAW